MADEKPFLEITEEELEDARREARTPGTSLYEFIEAAKREWTKAKRADEQGRIINESKQ